MSKTKEVPVYREPLQNDPLAQFFADNKDILDTSGEYSNLEQYTLEGSYETPDSVGKVATELEVEPFSVYGIQPRFTGKDSADLKFYTELRAQRQPLSHKIANSVVKTLGTFATSAIDSSIVGVLSAGITSASNIAGTEDWKNLGRNAVSGLWDNPISNAMASINEYLENQFPNYRTQAEQDRKWYQNAISADGAANFWGDSVFKNLGFTVGALVGGASTAEVGAIGSLIKVGMKRNASKLGKVLGDADKAESILTGLKNGAITIENLNDSVAQAAKSYKRWNAARQANSILAASASEARMETVTAARDFKEKLLEEGWNEQDASKMALTMGNITFGTQTALLAITNSIGFGRFFDGGLSNKFAKNKFVSGNFKEGFKVADSVKGAKSKAILKSILVGGTAEGGQELGQAMLAKGSEYYTEHMFSGKAHGEANTAIGSFINGMIEMAGSDEGMENFFLGALLGAGGLYLPKRMSAAEIRETYGEDAVKDAAKTARYKWGWQGGWGEALNEVTTELNAAPEQVEQLNRISDHFKEYTKEGNDGGILNIYYQGLVKKLGIEAKKDEFLNDNNLARYEMLETEALANDLAMLIQMDRLDILEDALNEAESMTAEQIRQKGQHSVELKKGETKTTYNEEGIEVEEKVKEPETIQYNVYHGMNDEEIVEEHKKSIEKIREFKNQFKETYKNVALTNPLLSEMEMLELTSGLASYNQIDKLSLEHIDVFKEKLDNYISTILAQDEETGTLLKAKVESLFDTLASEATLISELREGLSQDQIDLLHRHLKITDAKEIAKELNKLEKKERDKIEKYTSTILELKQIAYTLQAGGFAITDVKLESKENELKELEAEQKELQEKIKSEEVLLEGIGKMPEAVREYNRQNILNVLTKFRSVEIANENKIASLQEEITQLKETSEQRYTEFKEARTRKTPIGEAPTSTTQQDFAISYLTSEHKVGEVLYDNATLDLNTIIEYLGRRGKLFNLYRKGFDRELFNKRLEIAEDGKKLEALEKERVNLALQQVKDKFDEVVQENFTFSGEDKIGKIVKVEPSNEKVTHISPKVFGDELIFRIDYTKTKKTRKGKPVTKDVKVPTTTTTPSGTIVEDTKDEVFREEEVTESYVRYFRVTNPGEKYKYAYVSEFIIDEQGNEKEIKKHVKQKGDIFSTLKSIFEKRFEDALNGGSLSDITPFIINKVILDNIKQDATAFYDYNLAIQSIRTKLDVAIKQDTDKSKELENLQKALENTDSTLQSLQNIASYINEDVILSLLVGDLKKEELKKKYPSIPEQLLKLNKGISIVNEKIRNLIKEREDSKEIELQEFIDILEEHLISPNTLLDENNESNINALLKEKFSEILEKSHPVYARFIKLAQEDITLTPSEVFNLLEKEKEAYDNRTDLDNEKQVFERTKTSQLTVLKNKLVALETRLKALETPPVDKENQKKLDKYTKLIENNEQRLNDLLKTPGHSKQEAGRLKTSIERNKKAKEKLLANLNLRSTDATQIDSLKAEIEQTKTNLKEKQSEQFTKTPVDLTENMFALFENENILLDSTLDVMSIIEDIVNEQITETEANLNTIIDKANSLNSIIQSTRAMAHALANYSEILNKRYNTESDLRQYIINNYKKFTFENQLDYINSIKEELVNLEEELNTGVLSSFAKYTEAVEKVEKLGFENQEYVWRNQSLELFNAKNYSYDREAESLFISKLNSKELNTDAIFDQFQQLHKAGWEFHADYHNITTDFGFFVNPQTKKVFFIKLNFDGSTAFIRENRLSAAFKTDSLRPALDISISYTQQLSNLSSKISRHKEQIKILEENKNFSSQKERWETLNSKIIELQEFEQNKEDFYKSLAKILETTDSSINFINEKEFNQAPVKDFNVGNKVIEAFRNSSKSAWEELLKLHNKGYNIDFSSDKDGGFLTIMHGEKVISNINILDLDAAKNSGVQVNFDSFIFKLGSNINFIFDNIERIKNTFSNSWENFSNQELIESLQEQANKIQNSSDFVLEHSMLHQQRLLGLSQLVGELESTMSAKEIYDTLSDEQQALYEVIDNKIVSVTTKNVVPLNIILNAHLDASGRLKSNFFKNFKKKSEFFKNILNITKRFDHLQLNVLDEEGNFIDKDGSIILEELHPYTVLSKELAKVELIFHSLEQMEHVINLHTTELENIENSLVEVENSIKDIKKSIDNHFDNNEKILKEKFPFANDSDIRNLDTVILKAFHASSKQELTKKNVEKYLTEDFDKFSTEFIDEYDIEELIGKIIYHTKKDYLPNLMIVLKDTLFDSLVNKKTLYNNLKTKKTELQNKIQKLQKDFQERSLTEEEYRALKDYKEIIAMEFIYNSYINNYFVESENVSALKDYSLDGGEVGASTNFSEIKNPSVEDVEEYKNGNISLFDTGYRTISQDIEYEIDTNGKIIGDKITSYGEVGQLTMPKYSEVTGTAYSKMVDDHKKTFMAFMDRLNTTQKRIEFQGKKYTKYVARLVSAQHLTEVLTEGEELDMLNVLQNHVNHLIEKFKKEKVGNPNFNGYTESDAIQEAKNTVFTIVYEREVTTDKKGKQKLTASPVRFKPAKENINIFTHAKTIKSKDNFEYNHVYSVMPTADTQYKENRIRKKVIFDNIFKLKDASGFSQEQASKLRRAKNRDKKITLGKTTKTVQEWVDDSLKSLKESYTRTLNDIRNTNSNKANVYTNIVDASMGHPSRARDSKNKKLKNSFEDIFNAKAKDLKVHVMTKSGVTLENGKKIFNLPLGTVLVEHEGKAIVADSQSLTAKDVTTVLAMLAAGPTHKGLELDKKKYYVNVPSKNMSMGFFPTQTLSVDAKTGKKNIKFGLLDLFINYGLKTKEVTKKKKDPKTGNITEEKVKIIDREKTQISLSKKGGIFYINLSPNGMNESSLTIDISVLEKFLTEGYQSLTEVEQKMLFGNFGTQTKTKEGNTIKTIEDYASVIEKADATKDSLGLIGFLLTRKRNINKTLLYSAPNKVYHEPVVTAVKKDGKVNYVVTSTQFGSYKEFLLSNTGNRAEKQIPRLTTSIPTQNQKTVAGISWYPMMANRSLIFQKGIGSGELSIESNPTLGILATPKVTETSVVRQQTKLDKDTLKKIEKIFSLVLSTDRELTVGEFKEKAKSTEKEDKGFKTDLIQYLEGKNWTDESVIYDSMVRWLELVGYNYDVTNNKILKKKIAKSLKEEISKNKLGVITDKTKVISDMEKSFENFDSIIEQFDSVYGSNFKQFFEKLDKFKESFTEGFLSPKYPIAGFDLIVTSPKLNEKTLNNLKKLGLDLSEEVMSGVTYKDFFIGLNAYVNKMKSEIKYKSSIQNIMDDAIKIGKNKKARVFFSYYMSLLLQEQPSSIAKSVEKQKLKQTNFQQKFSAKLQGATPQPETKTPEVKTPAPPKSGPKDWSAFVGEGKELGEDVKDTGDFGKISRLNLAKTKAEARVIFNELLDEGFIQKNCK